jgi:hypothetical protein
MMGLYRSEISCWWRKHPRITVFSICATAIIRSKSQKGQKDLKKGLLCYFQLLLVTYLWLIIAILAVFGIHISINMMTTLITGIENIIRGHYESLRPNFSYPFGPTQTHCNHFGLFWAYLSLICPWKVIINRKFHVATEIGSTFFGCWSVTGQL